MALNAGCSLWDGELPAGRVLGDDAMDEDDLTKLIILSSDNPARALVFGADEPVADLHLGIFDTAVVAIRKWAEPRCEVSDAERALHVGAVDCPEDDIKWSLVVFANED